MVAGRGCSMALAIQALLVLSCLTGATGYTPLHHMPLGMQRMPLCRASTAAQSHFAPFAPARHLRSLRSYFSPLRTLRPLPCELWNYSWSLESCAPEVDCAPSSPACIQSLISLCCAASERAGRVPL